MYEAVDTAPRIDIDALRQKVFKPGDLIYGLYNVDRDGLINLFTRGIRTGQSVGHSSGSMPLSYICLAMMSQRERVFDRYDISKHWGPHSWWKKDKSLAIVISRERLIAALSPGDQLLAVGEYFLKQDGDFTYVEDNVYGIRIASKYEIPPRDPSNVPLPDEVDFIPGEGQKIVIGPSLWTGCVVTQQMLPVMQHCIFHTGQNLPFFSPALEFIEFR